jgi:hypothetical protein
MATEAKFFVDGEGTVRFIYSEPAAAMVAGLGEMKPRRASDVEPGPDGNWYADMRRSGGPILGPFPFDRRDAAIAAEINWLNEHRLQNEGAPNDGH